MNDDIILMKFDFNSGWPSFDSICSHSIGLDDFATLVAANFDRRPPQLARRTD